METGIEYSKEVFTFENTRIFFGDGINPMFEWVNKLDKNMIQDGYVETFGQDLFEIPMHMGISLGINILVSGDNVDNAILNAIERNLHTYLNEIKGIKHIGQRDNAKMYVTLEFTKTNRFKDVGQYLIKRIKADFGVILSKVQIKFIVPLRMVNPILQNARLDWKNRDNVSNNIKDTDVEDFYSCKICQSIHPEHLCYISPEKSGMCGLVNYETCKVSEAINASCPYEKINKGAVINEKSGEFTQINVINDMVTNGRHKRITLYSIMDAPESISSQSECIALIVPKCNGIMCITRNYTGINPTGLSYNDITALNNESVPAAIGLSIKNILESSFLKNEGGLNRLVWINKDLKNKLLALTNNQMIAEYLKSIPDESITSNEETLYEYLKTNNHPALNMEKII